MDNLTRLLHGLVDCLQLNLTYKTCVLKFRSVSGVNMYKTLEELNKIVDYVITHGDWEPLNDLKNAKETFREAVIQTYKEEGLLKE